ncbi:DNA utilization protein GntX [bacterium BMS3Bbin11]|nr:DNA utilization protein GntX [bacterium BMS3Abin11]GBE45620.1 DNA utilization protein GntX [bacterium BMS3Bbin11]GMT40250.1 MAG: amidophosphoribosyltransferase [bacterium]HDH09079.1 ComF family protein [Gammaproteobacteria bacterium]HDH15516.1 ComF family protein [Gammaproteobacteria bacterium]
MVYNSAFKNLLNSLLPVSCGLCNASTGSHLPLCQPCRSELPLLGTACSSCALPVGSAGNCGKCQQHHPAYDETQALFLYQEPVSFLVQQFKFSRKLEYGYLFSSLMAKKLLSLPEQPDVLIPVPLHPSRLRSRGFNQSWEITRQLSRITGINASHKICQRIKKTPLQTGLKASERKRNLKQAFAVTANVKDLHICIVDDVMTTGSTLEAIASVLKSAAAKRVSGIVVARAVL